MGFEKEGLAYIGAFAMATPLAPNLLDSCAAARAGISRRTVLKTINLSDSEALGQEPISGCPARYIAPGFTGIAKALLLGKAAVADLESRSGIEREDLRRAGIFVNLADQFYPDRAFEYWVEGPQLPSVKWAQQTKQMIPSLIRGSTLEAIPEENRRLYLGGHTGFVSAIQEAIGLLSAGQIDRCLVGGIDSCVEPRFVKAAAAKGVLKTSTNPVGFVPGEAAAFIWLERAYDAHGRHVKPAALILGTGFVSSGSDRCSDDPPTGVALARAIHEALSASHSSRQPVAYIISDLNGDEYRARDWGNALLRLRNRYNLGELPATIPALSFGETGAASAPIGLCLGITGQQRGWIPRGLIAAWSSADKGSRAAVCFASINGAQCD